MASIRLTPSPVQNPILVALDSFARRVRRATEINRILPGKRNVPLILSLLSLFAVGLRADGFATLLPAGVSAEWDLSKAYHDDTPSRERICINGLWQWQPASEPVPPSGRWGYFKVPGSWPGITDYMQKDSQTLYAHEEWRSVNLSGVAAAWYQREINVPARWSGRRIVISTAYLNSHAVAYVDGKRAGEMRFPEGEIDLTALCRPGEKQVLSLLVTAMPLSGVLLSYTDSASARQVKGGVPRRGLCGDVFLEGIRPEPGIRTVRVDSFVRRDEIAIRAAVRNLKPHASYSFFASVGKGGKELASFHSPKFTAEAVDNGMLVFTNKLHTAELWDVNSPERQLELALQLVDSSDRMVDEVRSIRFGFREFWIEGRDFYLNGKRIYLSAVPLDNAQVGVAWSTYSAARESLKRLKSIGINFVYTHNYSCEPGSHLSFEEILKAADDVGMLVALSQPHFSHYDWKSPEADRKNGYAAHARFYTGVAANHPSVVFYAMSHNATGYAEDMNPDMIDGIQAPRDQWALNNAKLALRAEAIVTHLDPTRIVYHHASGNLGSMHPMNFYPNWVPIQELSDWFGHWATNGVKPAFLCEYGAPFTWDWTMYRGWYKGEREFGSAKVPWEFCNAEWNAQFAGDRAYRIGEPEKANLRWEAKQFRAGNLWHRWDYPFPVGSDRFDDEYPVSARYLTENWRAFRGWGVSAISPWEYEHFWKLRPGVEKERQQFPTKWADLQRPGYSPDYIEARFERVDLAFERSDWVATPAAEALLRNNRPLLAFIAGPAAGFTAKDHNFVPGDRLSRQIVIINNSRETVVSKGRWSIDLPGMIRGSFEQTLPTGEQVRVPVDIDLPADLPPGTYELRASIDFSNGESQQDSFVINVLPRSTQSPTQVGIALFDPIGQTERLLKEQQIAFTRAESNSDLSAYDLLIVGKGALSVEGAAPDISRVREGLRVIIFEQGSAVLEKRFGFRVEEYGLRQLFPRVPDHPLLAGLSPENLHDWRGEATLLPSRLSYEIRPRYGPTVKWCDLPVTRIWRCGNRGNLASVLIEKPAVGDFLPILDGGYSLQYSPLLEYREGRGMVLFCQLDLTGRTETDPAADLLAHNVLRYVVDWKPKSPQRRVLYAGVPEGRSFLEKLGFVVTEFAAGGNSQSILVLGSGSGGATTPRKEAIAAWLRAGGYIFGLGLSAEDLQRVLPSAIKTVKREHISSFFESPGALTAFCGIGPADLHDRDPQEIDLVTAGAQILGDGVIACSDDGKVVLLQLAPWKFKTEGEQNNLRRTYRRLSFAASRLLSNLGASSSVPVLDRFHSPEIQEKRWLEGFYVDTPREWDDPYRFFRW